MSRPKPGEDKIAAALEAAQKIALQMDSDESVGGIAEARELRTCHACGSLNPLANRFCAKCGVPLQEVPEGAAPSPSDVKLMNPLTSAAGQHYYHHHYHHHYFASSDGVAPAAGHEQRTAVNVPVTRDPARTRPSGAAGPSRAEAALRKLTQDWALACNTKHLDDLVELYVADAIVLRANVPPIRSTPAIREFFFTLLEAGLGEVELEPLRAEVFGELAYDVGRCSMLVPSATGKRREERGKYVILAARQAGEWKILVDCWSSDLSLVTEPVSTKGQTTGNPASRTSAKNT